MSDSEDSTVTYTAVSSPFEGLSDIGSPGVDGPPMMPEDPYAYVVTAFQAPPSPDYVPGPKEPEQAPISPEFVPEPVYPEFMPPEDDSDPEEDDDEDPKEDPADYPTDRDDDDEEEEPSRDEADDEDEDEDDEEEEEHPAPTDSVPPPPVHRTTARISIPTQAPVPFLSKEEVERFLAIPTPPPSPLTPLSSPLLQIPSPPLPASPPLPVSSLPLRASPTHPLGYREPIHHLLPIHYHRSSYAPTARPSKGFRADYGFVATLDDEITRDPERDDTNEIYRRLDEAHDARAVLSGRLNLLQRNRRSHAYTTLIMEREDRLSCNAWGRSMDASDTTRSETHVTELQSQQEPARGPAQPDIPEEAGSSS
ncbi:hypothetical protein Tco_0296653 [Tanacetum coccineum]